MSFTVIRSLRGEAADLDDAGSILDRKEDAEKWAQQHRAADDRNMYDYTVVETSARRPGIGPQSIDLGKYL